MTAEHTFGATVKTSGPYLIIPSSKGTVSLYNAAVSLRKSSMSAMITEYIAGIFEPLVCPEPLGT